MLLAVAQNGSLHVVHGAYFKATNRGKVPLAISKWSDWKMTKMNNEQTKINQGIHLVLTLGKQLLQIYMEVVALKVSI